ncbi:MAG: hypothetical protein PWR21_400 [Methanoculleus sp.]|uniref:hypothetical protein n=1 Tax=Methanoculleus sp. TaxID=90427 RepID=UPI001BD294E1|nr:hypothetical protein [Methanoculleus sp.]MDK2889768.1 hypothetical protein [Methanoculleus sp.]
MKLRTYSCITTIILAILASAGCLGPVETNTTANITVEPTLEPCETCTVPEDFCGPPGVCPGEPVNEVYVFTDRNVYRIGEVVEFGIANCGDESVEFGSPRPWWIDRWVTNESGCMPGNCTGGTWELVGNAGCAPTVVCFLDPGENWRGRWDTSGANRSETIYMVADNLTPGTHCIWYEGGYAKEFEFV